MYSPPPRLTWRNRLRDAVTFWAGLLALMAIWGGILLGAGVFIYGWDCVAHDVDCCDPWAGEC